MQPRSNVSQRMTPYGRDLHFNKMFSVLACLSRKWKRYERMDDLSICVRIFRDTTVREGVTTERILWL